MVCISKPLPEYFEPSDIFRINLTRALYPGKKCIEDFVSESETIKSKNKYNSELMNLSDFFIEMGIKISLIGISIGILYGACRVLEYYGFVQKSLH